MKNFGAIRAAIIAMMLMFGSQAGADDAKLNPEEWVFLECKRGESFPSQLLAVKRDESSVINMFSHSHYDTCRAESHADLVCSDGDSTIINLNRYTGSLFFISLHWLCEKLDGPLF